MQVVHVLEGCVGAVFPHEQGIKVSSQQAWTYVLFLLGWDAHILLRDREFILCFYC